jgi:hypothetical protein
MAETNVTKLPAAPEKLPIAWQLGDTLIDSVVIKPLTFSTFVDNIVAAQQTSAGKSFEARLRRIRMVRQTSFYAGGVLVQVKPEDILKMPIPASRVILDHIDDGEGVAGKIIRDGDGVDKAIVYELGTPIPLGAGKQPIKELEFQASTYGDVEDVLAVDTTIQQALLLITTIGKPIGTSLSLLPTWAIGAITVADGITISREILPRFLGSPGE